MADWGLPTLSEQYDDFLDEILARTLSLAKMFDGTSETALPSGAIGYDSATSKIRKWNGSTWADGQAWITSHVASTSNPHATTAAQVGAPTTSAFNSHTSDTANPHATTAAQVGAPTTSAFNAHTGNTSNPHSTTAAQVGACAVANNLSELSGTAGTARTNIGAAAASDLSSHTGNTSNPHSVTRAQLTAAKSGANSDITSLTAVTDVGNTSNSLIHTAQTYHLFNGAGGTKFRLSGTSEGFIPLQTGCNLGGDNGGLWNWADVYFSGKLRRNSGRGSWSFFGGQPVSISSLDSELSFSGFDSNAQTLLRATARGVNQIAKWCVDHGLAD